MADDDNVAYSDNDSSDDLGTCKVYDSEDHFTAFVQFMLAGLALASLYVKRMQEVPKRKFLTWFLDISKQAFGACYAHVLNMVIAAILAENTRGDVQLDDQCAWYAINYLIDTTLGLVLSIMFLRILDYVANEWDWVSLKHSGVYHGKTGMLHWAHQMIAWLFILTIVKIIICYFMWLTSPILAFLGKYVFEPFQVNIRFELLFVMIFFPGLLNIIYFWITDSYLKAKGHHKHAHEEGEFEDRPEFVDTGGVVTEGMNCLRPEHMDSVVVTVDDKTERLISQNYGSVLAAGAGATKAMGDESESSSAAGSGTRGGYVGPTLPPGTTGEGGESSSGSGNYNTAAAAADEANVEASSQQQIPPESRLV